MITNFDKKQPFFSEKLSIYRNVYRLQKPVYTQNHTIIYNGLRTLDLSLH